MKRKKLEQVKLMRKKKKFSDDLVVPKSDLDMEKGKGDVDGNLNSVSNSGTHSLIDLPKVSSGEG